MAKKINDAETDAPAVTSPPADENQNANEGPEMLPDENGTEIKQTSAETVIYCGPNLPRANIRSMDVFRGGLPKHIKKTVEKIPEIASLIVPVNRLAEIKHKTETPGTEENRLYQAVLAERGKIENGV